MELNINIDHIATLRNARGEGYPNLVEAAKESIRAGADGIVCHLREDRRHIKDQDVYDLKNNINVKLDLEMSTANDIVELALDVEPEIITIVPEKRQELTTEGGLDVMANLTLYKDLNIKFQEKGIKVSYFVEPDKSQIDACFAIKSNMVELHTGVYANATNETELNYHFEKIKHAAKYAKSLGLRVAAGHGLNYSNTSLIASIKEIDELSIGHSVISRAVFIGLYNSVKELKEIISSQEKN